MCDLPIYVDGLASIVSALGAFMDDLEAYIV